MLWTPKSVSSTFPCTLLYAFAFWPKPERLGSVGKNQILALPFFYTELCHYHSHQPSSSSARTWVENRLLAFARGWNSEDTDRCTPLPLLHRTAVQHKMKFPTFTSNNDDEIPIIDLANPDKATLHRQLFEACSTWGFFQLINHNVDQSLVSSFQLAMIDFFALPYDTKLKLKRNARNARGYFDDELTKRRRDWKECLDVGSPGARDWSVKDFDDVNACLDGFNQFPTLNDCPKFRDTIVEYFDACSRLSNILAKLMAASLGLDDESAEVEFFRRMMGDHTSYLRMNYYPPCILDDNNNDDAEEKSTKDPPPLGVSPHRDAGFLTILLQDDDCHSLQVARFEDADDTADNWVTVHPIPGALTINTGDMAMIWSNGRFRAPLHRVLTNAEKKRYSAPFFYNPGYNELISPLDCCCRNEDDVDNAELQPTKYQPCLWGYFRALRFAGDLTDLGVEIQTSHFRVGTQSKHVEKQSLFMKEVNFQQPFDVEKYRHILEDKD